MPVKPENKARYPKNWKAIRAAVLERAGNACEGSPEFPDCRIANHSFRNTVTGEVTTDTEIVDQWELVDGQKTSRIVLTIAHLDHVPENCDGMDQGQPAPPVEDANLRALCQRCHLKYDAQHHAETARETRRNKLAVRDLFPEVNL